jgi:hypothetical protein
MVGGMMSTNFSVAQALKAAVSFVPRAWSGAWLVLGLLVLVSLGLPLIRVSQSISLMVMPTVLVVVLFILKLIAQGALYRIALFGRDAKAEGLGFGGIQVGRPELRLFWAAVVVSLFVLMIAMTIGIVFAIAFSMSGMAAGYDSSLAAVCALVKRHSGEDYIFIVYILAAVCLLAFLSLKLVLVPVANIAGRRLVTLNALGLTTGYVGRLFIGLVTLVLPFLLIGVAMAHYSGADMHVSHMGGATIALHSGLLILDIFGLFPLIVGFLASAYRQIMSIRSK